jgi:hypothetical protein
MSNGARAAACYRQGWMIRTAAQGTRHEPIACDLGESRGKNNYSTIRLKPLFSSGRYLGQSVK